VRIEIPTARGGARAAGVLPAGGAAERSLVVAFPDEVAAGQGVDVVIRAERAVSTGGLFAASLQLVAIRQR
jgi:hypothetical protein